MEGNWAPARVRRNFRIDAGSALCTGVYISIVVTFMPVVVRRMGGSAADVALVIAATTVVSFVIAVANIGAYTWLMQGIYPDRERAKAMANVRIGASIAGIAGAAIGGAFI